MSQLGRFCKAYEKCTIKKLIVGTVVGVALCLTMSGCSTTTTTQSIWPAASPHIWLNYTPERANSADQTLGVLKNLQQSFVEWDAGEHFSSFDVDEYGLRAKWEWTEAHEQTSYVPSTGGFFVGWDYVPTYGGSYQTQTYTTQHNDMFIISFADIKTLRLYHMPIFPRNYKYGLIVVTDKGQTALRVSDEKSLFQVANALATLALLQGATLPKFTFGVQLQPLTPVQRENISLLSETGLLVTKIAKGSYAEKAGVQFLDVLLEFDGMPLNEPMDFVRALRDAYSAKKKNVSLKLIKRETITQPVVDPKTQKVHQEQVEKKVEKTINLDFTFPAD